MSETHDGLQEVLNVLGEYCERLRLQVNVGKTNTAMPVEGQDAELPVE